MRQSLSLIFASLQFSMLRVSFSRQTKPAMSLFCDTCLFLHLTDKKKCGGDNPAAQIIMLW
ncbi:hypothetical protein AYY17_12810 [Morganella psychrotolerans]|uniref:Uncharacterized protein n=1 Tax=Morganella psychrotolerans TaxID=368603 RepID=A0A1B8H0C8_9GAMM|nr:hypothetical protein AYY17_12810 [Morganella psychrotolerans]